jgi:hypothetical protein
MRNAVARDAGQTTGRSSRPHRTSLLASGCCRIPDVVWSGPSTRSQSTSTPVGVDGAAEIRSHPQLPAIPAECPLGVHGGLHGP